MSDVYLINGQPPEAYGVRMASVTFRSQAYDLMQLDIVREDLASSLFYYTQPVSVTRNGAGFFVGRVARQPIEATGRDISERIELRGPWWDLERCIYKQSWENVGLTTNVVLGVPPNFKTGQCQIAWGQTVDTETTDKVIERIVKYAQSCGAMCGLGVPISGKQLWPLEYNARTCAELIKEILRWHPDVTTYFVYGPGGGSLNFRHSTASGGYTINLSDATVSALNLRRLDENRVPVVAVHYETRKADAYVSWRSGSDVYPLGSSLQQLDALEVTVTAKQAVQWQKSLSANPAIRSYLTPKASLAQHLYELHNRRRYEGMIRLTTEDLPNPASILGQGVQVNDGRPEWSAMDCQVQTVTMDPRRGVTTIALGAPVHLGPVAPKEQIRAVRGAKPLEQPTFNIPDIPLTAYNVGSGNLANPQGIAVTPGEISGGELDGGVEVTMQGKPLSDQPPPVLPLIANASSDVWLKMKLRPIMVQHTFQDGDLLPVNEYRPSGALTVISAEIVLQKDESPKMFVFNAFSGAVSSDAVFYLRLAKVTWPKDTPGLPSVQIINNDNVALFYVPDATTSGGKLYRIKG